MLNWLFILFFKSIHAQQGVNDSWKWVQGMKENKKILVRWWEKRTIKGTVAESEKMMKDVAFKFWRLQMAGIQEIVRGSHKWEMRQKKLLEVAIASS